MTNRLNCTIKKNQSNGKREEEQMVELELVCLKKHGTLLKEIQMSRSCLKTKINLYVARTQVRVCIQVSDMPITLNLRHGDTAKNGQRRGHRCVDSLHIFIL